MHSDASIDELRKRRDEVLRDKEKARLRNTYGEQLAQRIGVALGRDLNLSDFDLGIDVPFKVDWPSRIEEADGLVMPYVSKESAMAVAECIDNAISSKGGLVGIHGNSYLGLCVETDLKVAALVAVSAAIEDAVVFYPHNMEGAIVVDCYPSNPGGAFSLFVQGDELITSLAPCFDR
jgi:hypothetical protein